jgi:hypothetical protein
LRKKKTPEKNLSGDLMQELMTVAKKAKTKPKPFVCEFCKKGFTTEKFLAVHMCERKSRFKSQHSKTSQVGLLAFQKYYAIAQGVKSKTFSDFAGSAYYGAFVRFAAWCLDNNIIDQDRYLAFLLRNNKPIDQWTRESFYKEFLEYYIKIENAPDALERTIITIQKWSEEEDKPFNEFFKLCGPNTLVTLILAGRISPWVLYNCDSGQNAIAALDSGQLQLVWKFVDPTHWQKRIKEFPVDVAVVKELLEKANF